jgi:uncharacterized protein YndB with AHSA1/START domain
MRSSTDPAPVWPSNKARPNDEAHAKHAHRLRSRTRVRCDASSGLPGLGGPQAKSRWSDCHAEHTSDYRLDFRPFGHETHRVVYPDGRIQHIEKAFFDIVDARRIVFAYDIQLDARRLSVSLVTVEFFASRRGTRMVYAEQLTYLDGHEDRAQRLRGTEEGFERLALNLSCTQRLADLRPTLTAVQRTVASTRSWPAAGAQLLDVVATLLTAVMHLQRLLWSSQIEQSSDRTQPEPAIHRHASALA